MMLEHALEYVGKGWAVFPLLPGAKIPFKGSKSFKSATKDHDTARSWWARFPEANIGIATGRSSGLFVVDVDVKKGAKGRESIGRLKGLPPTLTAATPSGGWHLYFHAPDDGGRSCTGLLPGIDTRGEGGYVVAPGSVVDGKLYEWQDPDAEISDPPAVVLDLMRTPKAAAGGTAAQPAGPKWVSVALAGVAEGSRNATCARLAGYWLKMKVPADIVKAELRAWGQRCKPPLPAAEVDATVESVARTRSGRAVSAELMPSVMSEDALACEFTRRHGEDLRYVSAWGQWMRWDGHLWKPEKTLEAFDLARQVCREAAGRADLGRDNDKQAARLANAATVAAVERLARADRAQAATPEEWDSNPWLLNTPAGAVDLHTGGLRGHARGDRMTKIAAAEPTGECPTWRRFLDEATAGDQELQAYLARVCGYALTGVTTEHALFFLYGTGANGKSVFLNTLGAVLGNYAKTAAAETFLESKSEHHPTSEAALMGARMVIASEVDQGRRWAEAKIKALTGGDKIAARFMRQDFFEYVPQFKLLIAGNHKPALRDVDEAMRRRMHLIPFTVTIPAEKRDHALTEKLLQERGGILRWAVDGCLEWQRGGLKPPKAVMDATDEYFQAEDGLGLWIGEACASDQNVATTTAKLYASWKAWAETAGEFVGSEKRFSQTLAARGFKKWREPGSGRMGFKGIALKWNDQEGV